MNLPGIAPVVLTTVFAAARQCGVALDRRCRSRCFASLQVLRTLVRFYRSRPGGGPRIQLRSALEEAVC